MVCRGYVGGRVERVEIARAGFAGEEGLEGCDT